jgi:hypothetical protein
LHSLLPQVPAESRIPVLQKPQQLPCRIAFPLRPHNEKATKRPSSLLELFGRNKVAAVAAKPMSVPPGPAPLSVKPDHVKKCRTSEEVEARECRWDAATTGAVTSAHVGHRVSVSGTKVRESIVTMAVGAAPTLPLFHPV